MRLCRREPQLSYPLIASWRRKYKAGDTGLIIQTNNILTGSSRDPVHWTIFLQASRFRTASSVADLRRVTLFRKSGL